MDRELTETEIDRIAEKAAEKALNIVYREIGKGVLRKLAWLAGIAFLGLLTWLSGKGLIK